GATATAYLLPPVISAFREQHPGLRFYVREAGSNAVAAAVAGGELDIGIVTLPLRATEKHDLITRPLVKDELRLIVPPGGSSPRKATGDGFRWQDLVGLPVVAFEAGTAVRQVVDDAARKAGVTLDVVMEVRSVESIQSMVAAGIGVGFVSKLALGDDGG